MTDYRWNKDTRKKTNILCPECEQANTLNKLKYDENIDYYFCKKCSKEWWEDEIIKKEYSLGVFKDADGEIKFMHYNDGWRERTSKRKGLRKSEFNLLRKIRRK